MTRAVATCIGDTECPSMLLTYDALCMKLLADCGSMSVIVIYLYAVLQTCFAAVAVLFWLCLFQLICRSIMSDVHDPQKRANLIIACLVVVADCCWCVYAVCMNLCLWPRFTTAAAAVYCRVLHSTNSAGCYWRCQNTHGACYRIWIYVLGRTKYDQRYCHCCVITT